MKVKTLSFVRSALASSLLLGALLAAAPATASAADTRNFSATISPVTSAAGVTQAYTITLTNAATPGNKKIKSASFTIPSGWTVGSLAVSQANWTVAQVGSEIQIQKATGADLNAGASLTVTFNGTAPNSAGTGTWTAAAYESPSLTGTPHTITSSQPVVTVSAPTTGTLTVTKVVVGGAKVVADFPLTVDGFAVTSGVATTTSAASHTVAETSAPNYVATWGGDCNSSGVVTVPAGGSASCTLTNTYVPFTGTLTVNKVVDNTGGGTAVVADFPLFVDGLSVTSGVATTTVEGGSRGLRDRLVELHRDL